jgi:replicative DNA helicase
VNAPAGAASPREAAQPYANPLLAARQPPQNEQAEQALLGALLANNKAITRVEEFLRPEHFYDPLNGRIYAAILARIAAGGLADAISMRTQFENDPTFAEPGGGAVYLGQLLMAMVGVINAGEYGRAVRDTWMRRELIDLCMGTIEGCFSSAADVTPAGLMEALDAGLLRVLEGAGDESPVVEFGAAIAQQLVETLAASQRDSPLAGRSTGYPALDRMTLGLQDGKLILLAARPSMGKTALGLGIAVRAAEAGARTLFWSGEMSAAQLGARAAAAHAGLSTTSVFSGRKWEVPADAYGRPERLSVVDWDRLAAAERAACTLPLVFDTRPGITPQALRARARRMKRRRGGGLDLIVADYVGLMRPSAATGREKLYESVTKISAELMALKAELGVPVLALVQLNRQNEGREDKTPQLNDLRDSGALEQDADVVMMLHRPHYYLSRGGEPVRHAKESDEVFYARADAYQSQLQSEKGRAIVTLPKNRQGPTGTTRLRFDDATTWFRDESEKRAPDGRPDTPAWSGRLLR